VTVRKPLPESTTNSAVLRARELRRAPTPPEYRLWQVLSRRPGGLKFRRQHPLGRLTLDFYCPAAKLVIEIDGDSHSMGERPQRDAARDAWLGSQGLRVVRYDARDVMNALEAVVTDILRQARR
jgi:very-short-patch-repair endonuclease